MNLRKRAISGIMLAGSMVVMCAIADAASTVSAEAVAVVADTRTDLATDGTAGVVAQLNQINTDIVEMAAAGIEHSQTILVASADEEAQAVEDTDTLENASVVQNEAASIEESAQIESEEDGTAQDAGTTEDIQETVEENATDIENTENTETENTEETENIENAEDAGNTENTEDAEWQNRLMADVDEFLYVRASGDADAEIIGKLYKGDVADVVESGDTWTHVVSGDVDGYVNNDYCVSGEDALAYAQENVETEAQVNTNGLRVRNEASEDASVITAVSEGTTLMVDTDAEAEDGWVAVKYKGQTAYVSADYVSTSEQLTKAMTMTEVKYGQGVSDVKVDLVSYACQFVGNPYVWGGTSLTHGADCSGFTLSIFAKYGIYLPHSSAAQANCGTRISAGEAQPGDLFFYGSGSRISHVAIYIGNGQIVHASSARTGIKISNAYYRSPICVVRLLK